MTQKVSVFFCIPDDADRAEGVAGQTFAQDVVILRENLPNVVDHSCSEADLMRYANETFVDVEWLRGEKSTARSLVGIPLKVDSTPWGVIMVDSRNETIPNVDTVIKSYGLVSQVLGVILRRG